jgi:hypothetical protein
MKGQLIFAPEPFEIDGEVVAPRRHGRWFRQGDRIIVLLDDKSSAADQELGEVSGDAAGIRQAIQHGMRDENQLTDMIFNARHPERHGQRLQSNEPQLIQEWLGIRDTLVRPVLRGSSVEAAPAGSSQAQVAAYPPSTTSGIEADGNTTAIIHCILGLQDQGRSISFVQRYLRDLSRAEAAALSKAGLQIVSCYEYGYPTHIAYFTRAQGQHDGRLGFTQAQAVGQPAGTPVYFAVDTDPSVGQRQAILDYFQGIQDGYNQYFNEMQTQNKPAVAYAIGVYGSGCVLDWCQAHGIATWFWQAFAPGWCKNRQIWHGANIHTSGRDTPARCSRRLGHLEGWGNEGGWMLPELPRQELS